MTRPSRLTPTAPSSPRPQAPRDARALPRERYAALVQEAYALLETWPSSEIGKFGARLLQDMGISDPVEWAGSTHNLGRALLDYIGYEADHLYEKPLRAVAEVMRLNTPGAISHYLLLLASHDLFFDTMQDKALRPVEEISAKPATA